MHVICQSDRVPEEMRRLVHLALGKGFKSTKELRWDFVGGAGGKVAIRSDRGPYLFGY
jgi:hypothetical protein